MLLILGLLIFGARSLGSHLIWNQTPSIPRGLYWYTQARPTVGEIAVLKPPGHVADLAEQRGYLPRDVFLMKPVAAGSGETVCSDWSGTVVGAAWAPPLVSDSHGRALPRSRFCGTLPTGAVWLAVLGEPWSFDSRVFGPVQEADLAGKAETIWTF